MERLVCLGLSHRTAPVELRERFGTLGLGADRCPAVDEHVVLSTCYRVELHVHLAEVADGREALIEALADVHDVDRDTLVEHLYVHTGEEVARHLGRVAAGLDSLLLGESEILGQVRAASEAASREGSSGPVLSLLYKTAIAAGRRARSETAIGTNPATASSMALSLAEGVLGDLVDRRVLVVGVGRIGTQALRAATGRGISQVAVANRTRDRAEELVASSGAAYGLDELAAALEWADVAITATASEAPVLDVETVQLAAERRGRRPLVIVDLAVPADVERGAGSVAGVSLFDVDDLRAGLDETLASRLREVPKVEAIVEEEVATFARRYRELEVEPVLAALHQQAEAIRERELERALRHLGHASPEVVEQLEHLSRSLVAKLLHEPTARVRELAAEGDAGEMAAVLRELYGLASPRKP